MSGQDIAGLHYNNALNRCIDVDHAKGWASLFTFKRKSDETYSCVRTKVPIAEAEEWLAGEDPRLRYGHPTAQPIQTQLDRAESLLREIRDGKHSIPGVLVQIDRYFERRGRAMQSGGER